MKTFDYVRPATVREAVAAASEPGAAYLAAGTNLLDLMKGGITGPSRLVDISHLPGLDQIEDLSGGGVRIGRRSHGPCRLSGAAADGCGNWTSCARRARFDAQATPTFHRAKMQYLWNFLASKPRRRPLSDEVFVSGHG